MSADPVSGLKLVYSLSSNQQTEVNLPFAFGILVILVQLLKSIRLGLLISAKYTPFSVPAYR